MLLFFTTTMTNINAQDIWKDFDRELEYGSYKTAYEMAEAVFTHATSSADRLAAAYHMGLAAARYQEDVYDSAVARYRSLLPQLDDVEKALCYTFLNEFDSALAFADVLWQTPVQQIEMYCDVRGGSPVTPTALDVVILRAQNHADCTPQRRVELQRQLVQRHVGDAANVLIWHELRLLDLLDQVPNHPLTDAQILEAVDRLRHLDHPDLAQLYSRMAHRCNDRGEYVEALRWCDSAIAVGEYSSGGVECRNLRSDIVQPRIMPEQGGCLMAPKAESLQRVRYRNVDHLWFRIIPYKEEWNRNDDKQSKRRLRHTSPLLQWDDDMPANSEYRYEQSLFTVPALGEGRYLLLISATEDFEEDGFVAIELHVTDMFLVVNDLQGLLLDRSTGKPIAGQTMRLMSASRSNKPEELERTVTDADGRFSFYTQETGWNTSIVATRGGYTLDESYYRYWRSRDAEMHMQVQMRTDRPIYKPGDTVQVAIVAFRSDGLDARVLAGLTLHIVFNDPNGHPVESLTAQTDEFGTAQASFAIPQDRLAGQFSIHVSSDSKTPFGGSCSVRVEEYKQPKFMVTLDAATGQAPQFGKLATLKGLAASYNSVPVVGAKVHYKVRRQKLHRWWWRWWGVESEVEVAKGETVTDADGTFQVSFIPEPDSSVDLSERPTFEYVVDADVTDLNGETHAAVSSLRVGFRTAFLGLEPGSTMQDLRVRYVDINGNPLQGKPQMKVELLEQPVRPLLSHPLVQKGVHPIDPVEYFAKKFPRLAPDAAYNDMFTWKGLSTNDYSRSGVYRITLTAPDADTAVEYITHTPEGATQVNSQSLLWAAVDRQSARVGETVSLRFGSRQTGVEVYYVLRVGDSELDFRRIKVDNQLRSFDIKVDSSMLGGFDIYMVAVMDGIMEDYSQHVDVPFVHKQLVVRVDTFRDKLQPGEEEEWTITVRTADGDKPVAGNLILTMYDDALNSYGQTQDWGFSPWHSNRSPRWGTWSARIVSADYIEYPELTKFSGPYPIVWSLKEGVPYFRPRFMYRTYAVGASNRAVKSAAATMSLDGGEEEVFVDESEDDAMPVAETLVAKAQWDDETPASDKTLRTNLNTLAFFAPRLHTDADGKVTYRFRVPELLTRWNIRGLAVTKDVKIGTLDKSLITSKPLMVQPNIPRFLRCGDTLSLMAKVINQSGSLQECDVHFTLTDAATGKVFCRQEQHVSVDQVAQVLFDVQVPEDVYVATYRIVAQGSEMSDGEQGQLPVLANREAVTVSQAMFINGRGEKTYRMPQWLDESDTRQPNLVSAEVVSNPIWLAIKTMPYLSDLENPSSLFLANKLYVNGLGQSIMESLPIDSFAQIGHNDVSRLQMNEEVKQTLLQCTPWAAQAQTEVEQMQNVSHYFDKQRLQAEREDAVKKLRFMQNSDGGWPWMPEGPSSTWVSERVLLLLFEQRQAMGRAIDRALDYVDREEQSYFERYVKPYVKREPTYRPTDIAYLYARSLYGEGSTEAYKFYYKNALKLYPQVECLYTQAQLALLFHRNGDRTAALDILRRLKEKSLVSDEMGLYWRDNQSGWFWYQRPIETQALIIQAFNEITPSDTTTIALMQQWLLKQKQTTHWGNDAATTEAIRALTLGGGAVDTQGSVALNLFGQPMDAAVQGIEGYSSQTWCGDALDTLRASGTDQITLQKSTEGIAWGAVYYQFTEQIDRIAASDMGISISRRYLKPDTLHVGDRIKVRIDIVADRAMDYLEIVDRRPCCTEPLSTQAGWRWNQGLSYYIVVGNADTRCYVQHIDKGKYYFEYELYITNPGSFLSGTATMQCMYAPEFRAVAPAEKMEVRP